VKPVLFACRVIPSPLPEKSVPLSYILLYLTVPFVEESTNEIPSLPLLKTETSEIKISSFTDVEYIPSFELFEVVEFLISILDESFIYTVIRVIYCCIFY